MTPPAERPPDSRSSGAGDRPDRPAAGAAIRAVCGLVVVAILMLAISSFHAWQLPRWWAWSAGIAASVAVVRALLSLSRRRRAGFYGLAAAVVLLAGVASVLIEMHRRGADVESGALARPLLVQAPDTAEDGPEVRITEQLLEGLSMLPGLDVIASDATVDPASASPGQSLAVSLEIAGGAATLSARLLGPDGGVVWTGEQSDPSGDYGPPVARLTLDVAAQLGIVVDDSTASRLVRLGTPPVHADYFAVLREWRLRGPGLQTPADALRRLDGALELRPDFAPARSLAANIILAARGSIGNDRVRVLTGLVDDARANQALAKSLALEWRADAASERFEAARRLAPSDVWIILDAALASAWRGECDAAAAGTARAVRLAGAKPAAGLQAAWINFLCGNVTGARSLAAAAEQSLPANASVQLLLASIFATTAEPDAARAALEQFDALGPDPGPPLVLAAYLYSLLDAGDDAARLAQAVPATDSGRPRSAASRGLAELADGDYLSALRTLRSARADPVTGADLPLIVGFALNAWNDPELNESPFRDVRERLLLR